MSNSPVHKQTKEYGLSHETLKKMRAVWKRYPGIHKVILYGSRAMGTFREGSDIDITFQGPLTHKELLQIEGVLDDLMLPYKFDTSRYHEIDSPKLTDHIKRVGKVLYSKKMKTGF